MEENNEVQVDATKVIDRLLQNIGIEAVANARKAAIMQEQINNLAEENAQLREKLESAEAGKKHPEPSVRGTTQ